MDITAFNSDEWEADLHRSLNAAVEATHRQAPQATAELIEPVVREVAQTAINSWRATPEAAAAPANLGWDAAIGRSLDAVLGALREQNPGATDADVEPLLRHAAQASLDSWQIRP